MTQGANNDFAFKKTKTSQKSWSSCLKRIAVNFLFLRVREMSRKGQSWMQLVGDSVFALRVNYEALKTLTHDHLKTRYQQFHNFDAANSWYFKNLYDILDDGRTRTNKNSQLVTNSLR